MWVDEHKFDVQFWNKLDFGTSLKAKDDRTFDRKLSSTTNWHKSKSYRATQSIIIVLHPSSWHVAIITAHLPLDGLAHWLLSSKCKLEGDLNPNLLISYHSMTHRVLYFYLWTYETKMLYFMAHSTLWPTLIPRMTKSFHNF